MFVQAPGVQYQNMLTKLKAVYTLVEQLYTGSQCTLASVTLSKGIHTKHV